MSAAVLPFPAATRVATRQRVWPTIKEPGTLRVSSDLAAAATRNFAARSPLWAVYGPDQIVLPGQYLARLFFRRPTMEATSFVLLGKTLEELHRQQPGGLATQRPQPGDDPTLVEVWL